MEKVARKCVKFCQGSRSQTFCEGPGVNSFVFQATGYPSQPFNIAADSRHSRYVGKKYGFATTKCLCPER